MRGNPVYHRIQAGLLSGLLLATLLSSGYASAAADDVIESITLSPVSKEYDLKAGSEKSDTFTLINDGKVPYDVIFYARPYSVTDELYVPNFTNDAQNADAYRWVQFAKPSYHLTAGETKQVAFTIRVPADATPGGHYGVMFAETQPKSGVNTNSVQRKKRVGAIMYITVDGKYDVGGTLAKTTVPFFQSKAPLFAQQTIKNTGNTHFSVATEMKVSDIFGGLKFKTDKTYQILPKTTRQTRIEWPTPSWLGIYKVELSTKLLDNSKSSTHYILFVPYWVYAVIALLVGARVLYALAHRKR